MTFEFHHVSEDPLLLHLQLLLPRHAGSDPRLSFLQQLAEDGGGLVLGPGSGEAHLAGDPLLLYGPLAEGVAPPFAGDTDEVYDISGIA